MAELPITGHDDSDHSPVAVVLVVIIVVDLMLIDDDTTVGTTAK
jgi:hypothetical protein